MLWRALRKVRGAGISSVLVYTTRLLAGPDTIHDSSVFPQVGGLRPVVGQRWLSSTAAISQKVEFSPPLHIQHRLSNISSMNKSVFIIGDLSVNPTHSVSYTFLQVAMSRFDTDRYIPYEKLSENLRIVRDRLSSVKYTYTYSHTMYYSDHPLSLPLTLGYRDLWPCQKRSFTVIWMTPRTRSIHVMFIHV